MSENHQIETIDLGGGLGIDYSQDLVLKISEYSKLVTKYFGNYDCNIIFEPGRRIVGNAGILIAQVICIKSNVFTLSDDVSNPPKSKKETKLKSRSALKFCSKCWQLRLY